MRSVAYFCGGCFYGLQKLFQKQFPTLISTRVGYSGGHVECPTYKQVCQGNTGHAETLQIVYDEKVNSYRDLVWFFFRIHDPTTLWQQGKDIGPQYRSLILYTNEEQMEIAEEVMEQVQQKHYPNRELVTEIESFTEFYIAEEIHQNYLIKYPGGYCNHRLRW